MNQDAITLLVNHENTGKVFFHRNSDNSLTVFIRDPRIWGGNPNTEHWALAQQVVRELQALKVRRTGEIKIDRQSGTLTIRIEKFYSQESAG